MTLCSLNLGSDICNEPFFPTLSTKKSFLECRSIHPVLDSVTKAIAHPSTRRVIDMADHAGRSGGRGTTDNGAVLVAFVFPILVQLESSLIVGSCGYQRTGRVSPAGIGYHGIILFLGC